MSGGKTVDQFAHAFRYLPACQACYSPVFILHCIKTRELQHPGFSPILQQV
jgi:hypothetical protein